MKDGRIILNKPARRRLRDKARRTTDARLRSRYLIVALSAEGMDRPRIAQAVNCNVATVSKVRRRWLDEGAAGLIDRREDNGERKADDRYARTLLGVVARPSTDFGHRRPTWTLRLLIATMKTRTGVEISPSRMSRLLRSLRVRLKSPKPLAPCPWSEKARKRRVKQLRRLIESMPRNEACVWEDETDIDLNPRLGKDWMPPGVRRSVMTPGKNVKHQLAAALDARTDRLVWVGGKKKDSGLFISLLKKLLGRYEEKRVIHVILDNYGIHASKRTKAWLAEHGRKVRLHFLPPYCPDDNRIEVAVWRQMHAEVTYHHQEETIEDLMAQVRSWLIRRDRRDKQTGAESRKAV
jgi:transposase